MTSYFVTGATGFIGRHLVERLLEREGTVYLLVREASQERLAERCDSWAAGDRVVPVVGGLESPLLGVEREVLEELTGTVDHFFHLAALYDMSASAEQLEEANLLGTWHAVQLANATRARCFHHVSSIAAAGRYRGVFREDMFDEATGFDDPYFRTKHESEQIVRSDCRVPWRIYRPGIVVGHSETGEMDKIDGPYYLFGILQRLAAALPGRLPLLGVDGGSELNIVPVDFVAAALDHIAHEDELSGDTFHLVDPDPMSTVETINTFARIAGAPYLAVNIGGSVGARLMRSLGGRLGAIPMRAAGVASNTFLGVPSRLVRSLDSPTRFDCRNATEALAGTGIEVPPLDSYAPLLWSFWEEELDADIGTTPGLQRAVESRRVLITGASAGIGRATALKLGAAGATVLLVARSEDRLEQVRDLIEQEGGEVYLYPADLSSVDDCNRLAEQVLREHGGVDVLINNAGHSIRRSLDDAVDRFHDYERTMQLNYFGALNLTLHFVPGMRERHDGHIVNISSMGVQLGEPRFSAYVASKAALDAFARSASAELFGDGVFITTVYMPLVRTAMSKPTRLYDLLPELTSAQAADWICRAIVRRPRRISVPGAWFPEAAYVAAPRLTDAWMNGVFRASEPGVSPSGTRKAAGKIARDLTRGLPGRLRRASVTEGEPPEQEPPR